MATNSMMTPSKMAKPAKAHHAKGKKTGGKMKAPPHDIVPKDEAMDRNFTSKGTPKLNAMAGSGSTGQRR